MGPRTVLTWDITSPCRPFRRVRRRPMVAVVDDPRRPQYGTMSQQAHSGPAIESIRAWSDEGRPRAEVPIPMALPTEPSTPEEPGAGAVAGPPPDPCRRPRRHGADRAHWRGRGRGAPRLEQPAQDLRRLEFARSSTSSSGTTGTTGTAPVRLDLRHHHDDERSRTVRRRPAQLVQSRRHLGGHLKLTATADHPGLDADGALVPRHRHHGHGRGARCRPGRCGRMRPRRPARGRSTSPAAGSATTPSCRCCMPTPAAPWWSAPLLFEALEVACDVARRTGGAVDPTVGNAVAALGYDADLAEVLRRPPVPPRALGRGRRLRARPARSRAPHRAYPPGCPARSRLDRQGLRRRPGRGAHRPGRRRRCAGQPGR